MSTTETGAAAPAAANPPSPPPEQAPSPGAILRHARERAGLGTEDLAGQLKLAKGVVEALERDDFVTLSEPVYVRGYYRKIAKVLPVSESELIGAYNTRVKPSSPTAPLRRLPLARGVAAGTSRHSQGPGIGVALGALVVAGIVFAVMTREPPRRLAEVAPAPVAQQSTPAPAPTEAAPAEPQGSPAPVSGQETTLPQSAPAQPAPAASATPPPAAVANQLVLDFAEASFVRVEDSRGRVLSVGLIHAGDRRAFDGTPPYTVLLGTAQGVHAYFDGVAVDFSAQISPNGTARFTVP